MGGACTRPRDGLRAAWVSVPVWRSLACVTWTLRFPWQRQSWPTAASEALALADHGLRAPRGRAAGETAGWAMPRGPRPSLWLLLLLPLTGVLSHRGPSGPREAAEEAGSGRAWPAFQGLQERLRAASALSRRYWALFRCRVWPKACEQDEKTSAPPLGKTRPRGGVAWREPGAGWGAAVGVRSRPGPLLCGPPSRRLRSQLYWAAQCLRDQEALSLPLPPHPGPSAANDGPTCPPPGSSCLLDGFKESPRVSFPLPVLLWRHRLGWKARSVADKLCGAFVSHIAVRDQGISEAPCRLCVTLGPV